MKISYQSTVEDNVLLSIELYKALGLSKQRIWKGRVLLILLFSLCILLAYRLHEPITARTLLVVGALSTLFFGRLLPLSQKRAFTAYYKANPDLMLPVSMQIDKNRVISDSGLVKAEYKWQAIKQGFELPNHFLLMTTFQSAWLIPKKALGTKLQEFKTLLKSKKKLT